MREENEGWGWNPKELWTLNNEQWEEQQSTLHGQRGWWLGYARDKESVLHWRNHSVVSLATERYTSKECQESFRFGTKQPLTNLWGQNPENSGLWSDWEVREHRQWFLLEEFFFFCHLLKTLSQSLSSWLNDLIIGCLCEHSYMLDQLILLM